MKYRCSNCREKITENDEYCPVCDFKNPDFKGSRLKEGIDKSIIDDYKIENRAFPKKEHISHEDESFSESYSCEERDKHITSVRISNSVKRGEIDKGTSNHYQKSNGVNRKEYYPELGNQGLLIFFCIIASMVGIFGIILVVILALAVMNYKRAINSGNEKEIVQRYRFFKVAKVAVMAYSIIGVIFFILIFAAFSSG